MTHSSQQAGPGLVARALRLAVRGYQLFVSPLIAPRCRFYPSCSAYAVTALTRHGALRGTWLAVRRLGRCHPWNPGGVDHVPPRTGPGDQPDRPHDLVPVPSTAPHSADGHQTAA